MPRDQEDKAHALHAVELFRRCTRDDLKALAAVTEAVDLDAGAVLCEQGRVADCCFVIVRGEADVIVADKQVNVVGPGESVGEMGLIDHLPRSATVVARTPIRAYRIQANRFEEVLASTAIARGMLEQLSRRIRDLQSGRRSADW